MKNCQSNKRLEEILKQLNAVGKKNADDDVMTMLHLNKLFGNFMTTLCVFPKIVFRSYDEIVGVLQQEEHKLNAGEYQ